MEFGYDKNASFGTFAPAAVVCVRNKKGSPGSCLTIAVNLREQAVKYAIEEESANLTAVVSVCCRGLCP